VRTGDRSDDADVDDHSGDVPDLTDVERTTDCQGDRCEPPEEKSYLF
jgi:hypothetical protein